MARLAETLATFRRSAEIQFYGQWFKRWRGDFRRNIVLTGLLPAAIISIAWVALDWLRSTKAERQAMSLGNEVVSFVIVFVVYLFLVAVWFVFRSSYKLHKKMADDLETLRIDREVDVEPRPIAAASHSPVAEFPDEKEPLFVGFNLHNHGDEAIFKAQIVEESLGPEGKGTIDDPSFPDSNVFVRWESPNPVAAERTIANDDHAKADFLFVLPEARKLMFLRPIVQGRPLTYKIVTYSEDTTAIVGELLFSIVDKKARERWQFRLSVEPANIGLTEFKCLESSYIPKTVPT